MKMTLSSYDFHTYWPEPRKDQLSWEALEAIYNYITEIEEGTGEETEFDPIAICCEWTEYDSALEAAKEYGEEFEDEELTEEEREAEALKYLQDNTTVLELDNGGVVIQQF